MSMAYASAFYHSKAWKKCRASFISHRQSINGGRCMYDGCERLGYIVHHKKHITPNNIGDTDITLNHYNLQWLCVECHNKIHSGDREVERYYFDSFGNVCEIVSDDSDT